MKISFLMFLLYIQCYNIALLIRHNSVTLRELY